MTDRPIPESYWVEPGHLLAGEYPGQLNDELTRRRINAFIQGGFDTFINLTRPNETLAYDRILFEEAKIYGVVVKHLRFPIGDFGVPTSSQMAKILDTIDDELKSGSKIYLHCLGGIGRTGTTVGCFLVEQGKSGEEALHQLSEWWQMVPKSRFHPNSPETREQMDFVRNWVDLEKRERDG
jgi:hypothetical protein